MFFLPSWVLGNEAQSLKIKLERVVEWYFNWEPLQNNVWKRDFDQTFSPKIKAPIQMSPLNILIIDTIFESIIT